MMHVCSYVVKYFCGSSKPLVSSRILSRSGATHQRTGGMRGKSNLPRHPVEELEKTKLLGSFTLPLLADAPLRVPCMIVVQAADGDSPYERVRTLRWAQRHDKLGVIMVYLLPWTVCLAAPVVVRGAQLI